MTPNGTSVFQVFKFFKLVHLSFADLMGFNGHLSDLMALHSQIGGSQRSAGMLRMAGDKGRC